MRGQHRADPIGHYSGQAWEQTGEPWTPRPPTDPPHLLVETGATMPTGPADMPSFMAAPVPGALELAHDQLEGADQADALELLEQPEPTWPSVNDLAWDALLERTRANFQLLRRMIL